MAMIPPFKKKRLVLLEGQTTASGNNTSAYGPAFKSYAHKGMWLYANRTAETGTCTMDVYIQGLLPGGDESNDNHWVNVTPSLFGQWADGTTGGRVAVVGPGMTGEDGGTDAIATGLQHTNGYLPETYRLRVVSGGTSVTNTFDDIVGEELP